MGASPRDKMKRSLFARHFEWPLFLWMLLAGCSASKPNAETTSSSAGDTATQPERALTPASTESLDSGGFIPDGYYLLSLKSGGRSVSSFELNTVTRVDSSGKLTERPTLLRPPVGFLTVSEPNSGNDSRYPCNVSVVAPDSLSVRCVATPVGDVSIIGHFLDKGDFSDKFAEKSIDLLVARVVITKGPNIVHDATHRFTYYTGD
jgi:hypothetical protein